MPRCNITGKDNELVQAIDSLPKEATGIYILWGETETLYVGKTVNPYRRIWDRFCISMEENWFNDIKSISFYPTSSEKEAHKLEWKAIRFFKPKYNRKGGNKKEIRRVRRYRFTAEPSIYLQV